MVFVSLGTQKQQFTRLLDYISNTVKDNDIIVQNGNTIYSNKKMKFINFVSYDEMEEYIKKADYLITHGGGGTVFLALSLGKKVICCPRLKKYKEHVNDHQVEFVDMLEKQNFIFKVNNNDEMIDAISKIESHHFKKYVNKNELFIKKIGSEIDKLLV